MGAVIPQLRDSARGRACTLAIPGVCNGDRETVVLAHVPSEVSGMGSKGHDFIGAFACSDCHFTLDHHRLSREDETFYWLRGMQRTQAAWFAEGLIVIAGVDPETVKRRPGKKANLPSRPIQSRGFQPGHRPIQSRPFEKRSR